MATWIKMRDSLPTHPKVVAMARHLLADPAGPFLTWFRAECFSAVVGDPDRHDSVTSRHEVANVMRHVTPSRAVTIAVTIEGLRRLWTSLNHTLDGDGYVACLALEDLDAMAQIPGFGAAYEAVGWVVPQTAGGLVFPRFWEHNTPTKQRGRGDQPPQTDAERSRAYRARKKSEKDSVTPVTSRHGREEKNREENVHSLSARDGDRDGWEGQSEDLAGLAATFPPTLAMVQSAGAARGLDAESSKLWHDEMTGCGWIDRQQRPIQPEGWRGAFDAWATRYLRNEIERRKPRPASPRSGAIPATDKISADPNQPIHTYGQPTR